MTDEDVKKFLRYSWRDLVIFALDLANLNDSEMEAIKLIGIEGKTIERASELVRPQVSTNTMQARYSAARKRLQRCWSGIEWIEVLAKIE